MVNSNIPRRHVISSCIKTDAHGSVLFFTTTGVIQESDHTPDCAVRHYRLSSESFLLRSPHSIRERWIYVSRTVLGSGRNHGFSSSSSSSSNVREKGSSKGKAGKK